MAAASGEWEQFAMENASFGVSIYAEPPKEMVDFMEHPWKEVDDLGVALFQETSMYDHIDRWMDG